MFGYTVELQATCTSCFNSQPTRGNLYIGRSIFNDVVLCDDEVMRRHAHIYELDHGIFIELMSVEARATVNGQDSGHISLLKDGDVIGIGSSQLRIKTQEKGTHQ